MDNKIKKTELVKNKEHLSGSDASTWFHQFTSETSVHGVKYVCAKDTGVIKKIAWAAFVLCMVAALIAMVTRSVISYYQYESVTSTKIHISNNIAMPAVSFCTHSKVSQRSLLHNYGENNTRLIYRYLYPFLNRVINETDIPHQFVDFLKSVSLLQYLGTFSTVQDVVAHCFFRGNPFDCMSLITSFVHSNTVCFTLHSQDYISAHGPLTSSYAGPDYGFTLILYVEPYQRNVANFDATGFKVLVHDPATYPMVNQRSFTIPAGHESYVAVTKSVSHYMKLPYSEKDCVAKEEVPKFNKYKWFFVQNYSAEACNIKCWTDQFYATCNCSYLSLGEDQCSVYDMGTCGDFYVHSESNSNNSCEHCLPLCRETTYQVKVSHMQLSNEATQVYNNLYNMSMSTSPHEVRNSYVKLHVYFEDLRYTVTRQVAVTDIGQLCSSFGGLMGLFLGASLLSIIECLDFLSTMCSRWMFNSKLTKETRNRETYPQ